MSTDMENDLLEHHHRIVELISSQCSQSTADIDFLARVIRRFLKCLVQELVRVLASHRFSNSVYLTHEQNTLSGADLICMLDPDLRQPDSTSTEIFVNDGNFATHTDLDDFLSLPNGWDAPSQIEVAQHNVDEARPGLIGDFTGNFAQGQLSLPPPADTHVLFSEACKRKEVGGNRQHTGDSKRRKSTQKSLQKSHRPALDPYIKYAADEEELCHRLSQDYADYTPTLVHIFREIGNRDTFTHFTGALQSLHSPERIVLPPPSSKCGRWLEVLERIDSTQHALALCRMVGLVHMRDYYRRIKLEIEKEHPILPSRLQGKPKEKRSNTKALDYLVQEAGEPIDRHERTQLRTKIRNNIAAGKSWSDLRDATNLGFLALLPNMAPSLFERVRSKAVNIFVDYLTKKRGSELSPIARILSGHLAAALEGKVCRLMDAISRGEIQSWHDLCNANKDIEPCDHEGADEDHT